VAEAEGKVREGKGRREFPLVLRDEPGWQKQGTRLGR
jgi:hypothetical protein